MYHSPHDKTGGILMNEELIGGSCGCGGVIDTSGNEALVKEMWRLAETGKRPTHYHITSCCLHCRHYHPQISACTKHHALVNAGGVCDDHEFE